MITWKKKNSGVGCKNPWTLHFKRVSYGMCVVVQKAVIKMFLNDNGFILILKRILIDLKEFRCI